MNHTALNTYTALHVLHCTYCTVPSAYIHHSTVTSLGVKDIWISVFQFGYFTIYQAIIVITLMQTFVDFCL